MPFTKNSVTLSFLLGCSLLFFFISDSSFSQTNADEKKDTLRNSIGFYIGTNDFHIREELASPLNYRNFGLSVLFQYKRNNNNSIHTIELEGHYGVLKPNFKIFYAENLRLRLSYNFLREVAETQLLGNRLKLMLGGGLSTFFNISQYGEYFTTIDIRSYPHYLIHSLEFSVLLEYQVKSSGKIYLKTNIPMVTNISRPDYSYTPAGDFRYLHFKFFGNTEFAWKSPMLSLEAGYAFRVSRRITIETFYEFQYSSYSEPRLIKMYMNDFRTGIIYNF